MNTHKVACLDVYTDNVRQVMRRAAPGDLELQFADTYDRAEQLGLVREAEFIMVGGAELNAEMIDAAERLRFIQKWGIGVDKIDVAAAERRNIPLAIAAGSNAGPVSELALGLMLAVNRRIPFADRALRRGAWLKSEMRGLCYQIDGKTVGLLGFGAIARMVAIRLRGFDVKVIYHDIQRADRATERALGATWAPFDDVLARSDILSLHTPLTAQTRNLIGEAALARMKPDAILINTARGGIVDEAALYRALVEGRLRGAGMDVFAAEPLAADSKLLALEQVVLTPHAGGGAFDNVENVTNHCFSNIMRILGGEALAPADVVLPRAS